MPAIVYDSGYSMGFPGLRYLHPFDSYRSLNIHKDMLGRLGDQYARLLHVPGDPISDEELARVHSRAYLDSLRQNKVVAKAVEIGMIKYLPRFILNWILVTPMRRAVTGSVLAGRLATQNGIGAVNLAGGFHHAKPERGEGFCIFSDIGMIVDDLRRNGRLGPQDGVVYIDLDAHQGNGVSYVFENDPKVRLFDMYNEDNYPNDRRAIARLDANLPMPCGCGDELYLETLGNELPAFLTRCESERPVRLAIYNAGTDVIAGDSVGQLGLSTQAVLKRDMLTIEELGRRRIPYVMLPSGGYTDQSATLVANTLEKLIR